MSPSPVTLTFDILTLKVVSESRVTWATCNLCANFGLPRRLCSRVIPDVRDRQTSDSSIMLNALRLGGGGIIRSR